MFKLYTDKINTFKCNVTLEGATESTSIARLIVEGENHNLMFDGKIKDGICEVNIGKFKNFDNFKSKGYVRLEVIADDVYFTPWKSEYKIEQSKNVVIEIIEEKTPSKPLVEVTGIHYHDEDNDTKKVSSNVNGERIYERLISENINFNKYSSLASMFKENRKAKTIVRSYINENKISGETLESTLKYLVDKF
jgi:hypothetical protein